MWIFAGTRTVSRPVPNGQRIDHRCDVCHEVTTFVEQETQENLRLYFVDVMGVAAQRVLRCSGCGTTVVSTQVDQSQARTRQDGTVVGHVAGWVGEGKKALTSDQAKEIARDAAEGARQVGQKLSEAARGWWGRKG